MATPSTLPSRRAVVVSERVPAEVSRALSLAGLEVRAGGDPSAPDVLLADPHVVADGGLESVIAARASSLLSRLGDAVPALHETVMGQTERGLFKAVLLHTRNHLGRASKILGLDRNTCARKARAFGLVDEPSRGRKPAVKPARAKPAKRVRRAAKRTR
ncbi:MAG: helix-turn-helix domain-containing protein [Myxococcales bacterium]